MAIFEFLITKGNSVASFHNKSLLLVDNKSTNFNFANVVSGAISVSYLCRDNKEKFHYEDAEFLILLRGTIVPDENGVLPEFANVARKLINDGVRIIKDLRGHFNILQINKRTNLIRILNDYFGLKPVYYGMVDDNIIISSSLTLMHRFNPSISKPGLVEKLIFQHNLLNNTVFENIFSLDGASVLSQDGNDFSVTKYHDWYSFIAHADSVQKFVFSKYNDIFCNKIEKLAQMGKSNLVTLTGGHDGRAVLSAFLKKQYPVLTFSFGRPGSENTAIPEFAAARIGFTHKSVYLEDDFENNYLDNALLTSRLSDGELLFTQQSTLYSLGKIDKTSELVFTGLLAGEVAGPVHLKTDYINDNYFSYILTDKHLTIDFIKEKVSGLLTLTAEEYRVIYNSILKNIDKRRNNLSLVKGSSNSHLIYMADMITWGFRKFYAYQMHLIRYKFDNIPLFYDFDLINLLINSNYNTTYKNSYKSLFRRRNSRRLQLRIICANSRQLSSIKLDRGYSPKEAICFVCTPLKVAKYLLRKQRIKEGKYVPDFLDKEWPNLLLQSESSISPMIACLPAYFKKDLITSRLLNVKTTRTYLSHDDVLAMSIILFMQNKV
jgi:hypothetical protein